ncbi:unnamed protein product [Rotaria sp. Silwood1]|nr:unnamed protein product [Rotaria sp. Silwood1]
MNNIISLIANLDYNNEIRSNPFVHILYSGNQNDLCQMLISVRQILNIFAQQNLQLEINNTKWNKDGITVAGGNFSLDTDDELNQLAHPLGLCLDDDQTIYIADSGNHRIVAWKSNSNTGQIVAGGNQEGSELNQLSWPTDVIIDKQNDSFIISDQINRRVMQWPRQNNTNGQIIISDIDCYGLAMDNDGYLYVSDTEKNEVKRWKIGEENGTVVAGGNENGNDLNQLNNPTFIFVDPDNSLYVSDSGNHRVIKWTKDAKEGIVVAGGKHMRISLKGLPNPRGVVVDQLGQIYVATGRGHVMGNLSKPLAEPTGLAFDQKGNLYVADSAFGRILKFEINNN